VIKVEIALPHDMRRWRVVRAAGYAPWWLRVRYHIESSRTLDAPVELTRVGSGV
jgi:hypothetical protein